MELELKPHSSKLSKGMKVGGKIRDQDDLWCGVQEIGGLVSVRQLRFTGGTADQGGGEGREGVEVEVPYDVSWGHPTGGVK